MGARRGTLYAVNRLVPMATLAVAASVSLSSSAGQTRPIQALPPVGSHVPVSSYRVVHVYPHDHQAFTQGLEYADGDTLYEGTGLQGSSTLRKVDLQTGRVRQQISIPSQYFGEGITVWRSTVLQLTWQSEVGFVYDLASFRQMRTFRYAGEGWGLTHDTKAIVMSDGSASLRFLDPVMLAESRRVLVTDAGVPIRDLNELEYVRGEIYANVWQTDFIARISPTTGHVLGWINMKGLLPPADRAGADVLNGIAYDATGGRLFVTGKLWPKLFQIAVTQ